MKVKVRGAKRKGVALVFALFTAALLMSMSATVVALSISHAREGADVDYMQAAIHACNWATEAALNYVADDSAWRYLPPPGQPNSSFRNPYTWQYRLRTGSVGPVQLGPNQVFPRVIELTDAQADEYGVYRPAASNRPPVYLIRFWDVDRPLLFYSASGSNGLNTRNLNEAGSRFAVTEVAFTQDKVTAPGQCPRYQLLAFARIYDNDGHATILNRVGAVVNGNSVGPSRYPSEGLLATRVTETWVREETASDFSHLIQNGRSWDAQGINLDGTGGLFEKVQNQGRYADGVDQLMNGLWNVGFPDGYEEHGKLRIDGGTRMDTTNGGDVIDGSAQFFNARNEGFANFYDEMTQQKNSSNIRCTGQTNDGYLGTLMGNGLQDDQDPIGLPQSGENSNYNRDGTKIYRSYRDRETYQSFAREKATTCNYRVGGNVTGGSKASRGVYVNELPPDGQVPDVYSVGSSEDIRPCFAKYVVLLGELNKAPAQITVGDLQTLSNGGSATNPLIQNSGNASDRVTILKVNELAGRVQPVFAGPASNIENGVISVQGGNVEVCGPVDSNRDNPSGFTGNITIVADVEASREDSLNYFNDSRGSRCKDGSSIYSDAARKYYEKHADEAPPYKLSKLRAAGGEVEEKIKSEFGAGAKDDAYVWPTPTSEATEREGNVFITSDLNCASTRDGSRGCIGIVAKNYISLNDKQAGQKNVYDRVNGRDKYNSQDLHVEAMLTSFDHTVQFDWTNDANSRRFGTLKTGAEDRKFTLKGCVVSSCLDVEGSAEGMGYINQEENSNSTIDGNPPFYPLSDIGLNWYVIKFIDRGSLAANL